MKCLSIANWSLFHLEKFEIAKNKCYCNNRHSWSLLESDNINLRLKLCVGQGHTYGKLNLSLRRSWPELCVSAFESIVEELPYEYFVGLLYELSRFVPRSAFTCVCIFFSFSWKTWCITLRSIHFSYVNVDLFWYLAYLFKVLDDIYIFFQVFLTIAFSIHTILDHTPNSFSLCFKIFLSLHAYLSLCKSYWKSFGCVTMQHETLLNFSSLFSIFIWRFVDF